MAVLKTKMELLLEGNVGRRAREYAGEMKKMGRGSSREIRKLERGIKAVGKGMDRLGNKYTAFAAGLGLGAAAKGVLDMSARYTRLGVQANISAEQVDELRDKIESIARQKNIRLDPEKMLAGVETIVEKTGDLDLATKNLEAMGLAMRAASAEGKDIGAFIADLRQKFNISDNQMLTVLDGIVTQGKMGSFTLGNLATQAERLTAAYASTGRSGPTAVKEIGAVMQVIRSGTGSSEMAATAFEAMIRTFSDAKKVDMIGKDVIYEAGGGMRNILDIMRDLIVLTDGDNLKLSSVFDAEAMRAMNGAIAEFKTTGELKSFEKFLNVNADGSQILKDSTRNAGEAAAALEVLYATGKKLANDNLAGPINSLNAALEDLTPEKLDSYANAAKNVALGIGGIVLATKAMKMGLGARRAFQSMKGGGGVAGAAEAALNGRGGIQKVFVTNMGGGMGDGGGMGGGGESGSKSKRGLRRGSKWARGRVRGNRLLVGGMRLGKSALGGLTGIGRGAASMAKRIPILGALIGGSMLADTLLDKQKSAHEKMESSGAILGGTGGAMAGAALGAAAGSVVPIIGTAIGGILGSILGGFGGEVAGGEVANLLSDLINITKENGTKQAGAKVIVEATPGVEVRGADGAEVDLYRGYTNVSGG